MDQKIENQGSVPAPETTGNKVHIPTYEMPELMTVSPAPHIKGPETTATVMLDVIIALLPACIWGVYLYGLRALAVLLISVVSAVGFEAVTQFLLHRPITVSDCSAAVTGLLLAMCMPATVPLWMPVIGAFFAIVVVKQLFGGIGKNFVNPALAARVFLCSWASEMSTFSLPGAALNSLAPTLNGADIVAGATPLATLNRGTIPDISFLDMLIGNLGGCIGEVSSLLLIAGGVYLLIRRVITWHIPVAYVGAVALLTLVFPRSAGEPLEFMLYEIFAGGLILGAFFMATDYTTSPVTAAGRLIFGAGCGAITVLIRYFGSLPEGVSYGILIMNLLVWYIDKATIPRRFGGVKHGK